MFAGCLKSTSLAALVAVAGIAATGGANAADLGGNCCADLEERIAELEATTARKGNRKVSLTVSGFVNEQVLVWDDGVETNAYQGTNETARTRFRFVGNAKIDATWSAGYLLELGVRGVRSDRTNQNNDDGTSDANAVDVRHSAWWLQNAQLGRVWVGQTSNATDGIQEINLANVGHFNAPTQFTDYIGGFLMRRTDGTLSNSTTLRNLVNDLPNVGEGNRFNVVKYETPTLMGFIASASWGEDDQWDVALRYAGEFNGIKIAAGVGYMNWADDERGYLGDATNSTTSRVEGVSGHEVGASASVMHVPTGLFLTGFYGHRQDDNRQLVNPGADERDEIWAVMAGIEQKFVPYGRTTLYGEYIDGSYGANNRAPDDILDGRSAVVDHTDVTAWGFGLNQSVDAAAMDIYIAYRNYAFDVSGRSGVDINGGGTGGVAAKASLEDIQTVTMGARIQF
jgi:hypothetical protein